MGGKKFNYLYNIYPCFKNRGGKITKFLWISHTDFVASSIFLLYISIAFELWNCKLFVSSALKLFVLDFCQCLIFIASSALCYLLLFDFLNLGWSSWFVSQEDRRWHRQEHRRLEGAQGHCSAQDPEQTGHGKLSSYYWAGSGLSGGETLKSLKKSRRGIYFAKY